MKVNIISEAKSICSNRDNINHRYFGWPSVTRLPDGKLAMVASGFRVGHACPFGKVVICYSGDEGKSWTKPAVVIDTPLDDRDAGIQTFGNGKVIVTSFNTTIKSNKDVEAQWPNPYIRSYLDKLTQQDESRGIEKQYFGPGTYVISDDGGYTFSNVRKSPVSTPHGPAVDAEGNLIYVGARSIEKLPEDDKEPNIECWKVTPDGSFEKLGVIPNIVDPDYPEEKHFCFEPGAIVLPDGKILVHIRVENSFTLFQSESTDGGKTFSMPKRLLPKRGGAPAHFFLHSSGVLISEYGYRDEPYGIKLMASYDGGETWEKDIRLYSTDAGSDLGYPCSVELSDGSILTVFYKWQPEYYAAEIMQIIWRIENE